MSLDVMANHSLGAKSRIAGPGASLRITPSNSPVLRPAARSPNKTTLHQSTLSLQTVLGTTTASANGFSSHDQSRSFAFCAGSAAVLAELDDENQVTQRFFRARPSATCVNPVSSFYSQSTPPTTPESRARPVPSIKANGHGALYNGSPSNDWSDGNGNTPRTWSSRERVKAITSVSISPNGRFLALGETGYNPRVLIFSTAKDSPPDVPLTIMSEHTIGVRSLAFSSNSQHLASLGDANDGFLFIWSINLKNGSAKLHSTNKCTAFIRDMCWMGQTLITVGVRHVKVWRLPDARPGSPSKSRLNVDSTTNSSSPPKPLSGRNCLLGSLGDHTFTCAAGISDREAVIGTDTGALCFLDDTEGCQKLSLVKFVDFGITSLTVDSDQATVWLGGRGRKMQRFTFERLRESTASTPSPTGFSDKSSDKGSEDRKCRGPAIMSMGFLSSHLATIDTTRAIHIYPIEALSDEGEQNQIETSMPGHRDPVLGIGPLKTPNELGAEFFTWSSEGTVNFWDSEGRCHDSRQVNLEQIPGTDEDVSNELRIVRTDENMDFFVSGDRYGVLRVIAGSPWQCVTEVRAHGGEITDIAIQPGSDGCLVATSGRDRMVQLFKRSGEGFELIQTMDDHVGAVGQLLFVNDGEKLLSCSADRTVLIRDRVAREVDGETVIAYIISKVIRLKASPASMALASNDPDTLVLSTVDRCIQRFNVTSGRHINSFRATDPEASDTVVMSSLTVASEISGQNPKLLIGVSSTDKSIRVYDFERDSLLAREFGHTEGVSDVLLLDSEPSTPEGPRKRTLVSAGIDGVVMIWNLCVQSQQLLEASQTSSREDEETPAKELTATKPPLRRILSRSELASFQRADNLTASPTPIGHQSPPLMRRRMSKFSLTPSSLKSGTMASATSSPSLSSRRSPTSSTPGERNGRSPSPLSPKTGHAKKLAATHHNSRRSSLDFRSRSKNSGKSEFGSMNMSTEQVCRTLRAYRKKLNGSAPQAHAAKELERELSLTLRILGARTKKLQENPETETDSSGKENGRLKIPSLSPKTARIPRRVPSTPNLGQKVATKVSRSRSLDADSEA